MSYAIPKFNTIKHRAERSKNGRGVAPDLSQYFTAIIAFGHYRIEKICGIKKIVTPKEQQTNELRYTEI